MAQFQGDDSNSTDLVVKYTLETDGEWGPYLYCNPVNASDEITGPWHCQVELTASSGGGPPPPQCAAANFSTYGSYCWKGLGKPTTVNGLSEGDCCSKAGQEGITKWNYLSATKECQLFKLAFTTEPCKGGVLGYKEAGPPSTPPCNCSRVHKTVGKENLTVSLSGYKGSHPAGGEWYSHPAAGQCLDGHYVGDGSGCTWRVVAMDRVINATCMYGHLDANVVNNDPSCFRGCPQPTNVTSDCYLQCYTKATERMSKDELAAPWDTAFAKTDRAQGGCPTVGGTL